MSDLFGDDLSLGFGDEESIEENLKNAPVEQTVKSKVIKTRSKRTMTQRAVSEENFYRIMKDWHLEDGATYNIITSGDIDFLTFVRFIVKQQKLKYAMLSTWTLNNDDMKEIADWVDRGLIGRIDIYVGEHIDAMIQYIEGMETIKKKCAETGGRFCVFRNHSKSAVLYGERFNCAISSSANINTNPRTEQTIIQMNTEICDFYKEYFDHINAFNKEDQPKEWHPWTSEPVTKSS